MEIHSVSAQNKQFANLSTFGQYNLFASTSTFRRWFLASKLHPNFENITIYCYIKITLSAIVQIFDFLGTSFVASPCERIVWLWCFDYMNRIVKSSNSISRSDADPPYELFKKFYQLEEPPLFNQFIYFEFFYQKKEHVLLYLGVQKICNIYLIKGYRLAGYHLRTTSTLIYASL